MKRYYTEIEQRFQLEDFFREKGKEIFLFSLRGKKNLKFSRRKKKRTKYNFPNSQRWISSRHLIRTISTYLKLNRASPSRNIDDIEDI